MRTLALVGLILLSMLHTGCVVSCGSEMSSSPFYSVSVEIVGSGTVTSSDPSGDSTLNCTNADNDDGVTHGKCREELHPVNNETLVATPASGWTFSQWVLGGSGGGTTTNGNMLTLTSATMGTTIYAITAVFVKDPIGGAFDASDGTTPIDMSAASDFTAASDLTTLSDFTATSDLTGCSTPTLSTVNPTMGMVGSTVSLGGTFLGGIGATVKFNGTVATIDVGDDYTMVVRVPVSATNGYITVSNGCSTAQSPTEFIVN